MPRIFVSYSRQDEPFARQLATSLSEMGADIWIDVEDIPAGMKWSSAIQQGLDTADLMIVIISPESMTSRNVEDEWQYYLDNNKNVIPILLRPSKIHFQLSRIQYVDFHGQKYDRALYQLYGEFNRKGLYLEPPPLEAEDGETVQASPSYHPPRPVESQPMVDYTHTKATMTGVRPPKPAASTPSPIQSQQINTFPIPITWIAGGIVVLTIIIIIALTALSNGDNDDDNADGVVNNPTNTQQINTQPAEIINTEPPTDAVVPPTDVIAPTNTDAPQNNGVGFPGNPVQWNDQWQPISETFSGVSMVLVPAGCYTMGSTREQISEAVQQCLSHLNGDTCNNLFNDESPTTDVCFDEPFWIDQYEVSNAQYGSAGTYRGDALPRTNITWDQAQAHCEARDSYTHLPTEAEWEYAARGVDGLVYPWGNQFNGILLNFCDGDCPTDYGWADRSVNDGYEFTAPVNSYPGGVSWVGAYNMAGNVWEWTSTIYRSYPYSESDGRENLNDLGSQRVLRGGQWGWIAAETRAMNRSPHANNTPSSDWYGFRCARDYQPGDLDN